MGALHFAPQHDRAGIPLCATMRQLETELKSSQTVEVRNGLEHAKTLQTAHCRAMTGHVLLWLDQNTSGDKRFLDKGAEIQIYPGCVSNPEPHPDISTRFFPPIEMAWYMLAKIENQATLNAGITENLNRFLPNGSIIEGQNILTFAKMYNALATVNDKLFVEALKEYISNQAFIQSNGGPKNSFDLENVTYGTIPPANREQQFELQEISEEYVLLFCANCVFKGAGTRITSVVDRIKEASGFSIRSELLVCLQSGGPVSEFYIGFAKNIYIESSLSTSELQGQPRCIFELAFNTLCIAQKLGVYKMYSKSMLPWLEQRWCFTWKHHRFLLCQPHFYEASIKSAFRKEGILAQAKVPQILLAILPTLGICNQTEVSETLFHLMEQ